MSATSPDLMEATSQCGSIALALFLKEVKNEAGDVTNTAEITAWYEKDIVVRNYISATVEDSINEMLMNCKTSHEMWVRLLAQHQKNSAENLLLVQQQFFDYKYVEGNSIMAHIAAIEAMATQLKDMGAPVDNQSIPGRLNNPATKKNKWVDHICEYCKKVGHGEKVCRKKHRDEEFASAVSAALNEKTTPSAYVARSTKQHEQKTDWYADSGCTSHMSDQRCFFISLRQINPTHWSIKGIGSDSQTLQDVGMGDIPIKVRLNNQWKKGIIRDVLFVPGLGANLFSVGAAADLGFDALFTATNVSISKNGEEKLIGKRADKRLYHLEMLAETSSPNQHLTEFALTASPPSMKHGIRGLGILTTKQ
ncbi:uncharacterized protein LOC130692629 [Daphnia carinata]|uniref:uncharacterized protein LOC130692629 n=1 Tax=Daphnia carinata TaxID=120202 RepID=UPI00257E79F0|nr:uncharacterized protein LOC130692629 [Daphnia carinata]